LLLIGPRIFRQNTNYFPVMLYRAQHDDDDDDDDEKIYKARHK